MYKKKRLIVTQKDPQATYVLLVLKTLIITWQFIG